MTGNELLKKLAAGGTGEDKINAVKASLGGVIADDAVDPTLDVGDVVVAFEKLGHQSTANKALKILSDAGVKAPNSSELVSDGLQKSLAESRRVAAQLKQELESAGQWKHKAQLYDAKCDELAKANERNAALEAQLKQCVADYDAMKAKCDELQKPDAGKSKK